MLKIRFGRYQHQSQFFEKEGFQIGGGATLQNPSNVSYRGSQWNSQQILQCSNVDESFFCLVTTSCTQEITDECIDEYIEGKQYVDLNK